MKRDPDQQAAIDVQSNSVVSAGAGSGKTSVLTSRYLRLVTGERLRVGEILALTFTRKAAAEMYERIYGVLADHVDDRFVAEQLADFDTAVISTLDSFCASVARNGCARFGVPTTFAIDERALRARCEQLALSFLTAHADEPIIADLIRLNRFGPLWKDGFARLAMNHFRVSDDRPLTDYLPEQRRFIESELGRLEQVLRSAIDGIAALDPEGPKCIQNALALIAGIDLDAVFASSADPGTTDASTQLARLASISKACGSSKHPDVPLFKEYVDLIRQEAERYLVAARTLAYWDDHLRLTELLEAFRLQVANEKRRTAILSYHDVMGLAIRTLVEDPALREYYKKRFRAIMIDEFQDNNEEQKALLYLISEKIDASSPAAVAAGGPPPGIPSADALDPAKLFFVGDEKQSIYRFRGADVSVFRTLAGELAASEAPLRLGANYRSEPGLIRFFNELFDRVLADAQYDYEARFEPLRWRDPTPGVRPRVELWQLEKRPSGDDSFLDDTDAEAYHIASYIRSVVEDGTLLVGDGVDDTGERRPGRPATWADFAILMRSSGNQIRLERTLRLFGIPYVSQAARSLFLEAPVNDIYQVLQLVLYPSDRVAYAGYLRSPLVGLSDEGIVRQLLSDVPLLEPAPGLSDDDRARMQLAAERYAEIRSRADSRPITELLHHIWFRWGYRYHLLRREEHTPYLEYYDLFWELAHDFEEEGLAGFLDEIRAHIGQNEKIDELEVLRGEATGVQIMTIHKSKGLEFPVVIVANAGNRGRNDSVSSSPYYWSDVRGLAFNTGALAPGDVREKPANYLYLHERDERAAQDLAEMKRLLYVAATRAESHLIFSGIPNDAERSLMGALIPAFTAAQESLADDPGLTLVDTTLEPVAVELEKQAHRAGGRREIARLAAEYAALPVVERRYDAIELSATALNALALGSASPAGDRAAGPAERSPDALEAPVHPIDAILAEHDLAARFGTYCHYCIEHGAELGSDAAAFAARLPGALRPEIPAKQLELFHRYGYELARGFLASDLSGSLATAVAVEHELPFLLDAREIAHLAEECELPPGLELVRGQIDLVAEFADRVLVVDFKSDRVLDPDRYRVQLAVYRAAAEALYARPVEVSLCHLRTATAVSV